MDDIWDQPVVQDSPKRTEIDDDDDAPQRPTKRSRQALFLADSDDDMNPGPSNRTVHKAPPAQDMDIEALFDGIDDDDDPAFKPLPASVNVEELTRQAEANYSKMPPLTPYQVMPGSSPSRDTADKDGSKNSKAKGKDGDEKKARRRIVKLDENRLLGENGFPQLIKMTKDFKIKGKGHEATDLNRLLQVYQYWTHQMYPKTQFQDTVERVETLCHSRRMTVALSVWRDEAHGKFRAPVDDEEDDDNQDEDNQMQTDNGDAGQPPSSPPRSSSPLVDDRSTQRNGPEAQPDEDDDVAFWARLEGNNAGSSSDVPPAPSTAGNTSMDEDEDMWDIVNEIEQQSASKPPAPPTPPAAGAPNGNAQGALALPPNPPLPDDDDWDDMYV
ncbi:hypothetical protein NLJ89_g9221 [Agrocybe chaxingu]|uniref:Chromosome segregation in meiosis protein n=1 Tax=Agrocybe chaxingu TaxID=84603 RepID=A0A9W8JTY0_9AGAR|nr:hypothetical protein NLJ89_g9221 [Agrocybe chaxingu]